jgi:hypothetical protein
MVDYTATQAQDNGVAPSANRKGGQTKAAAAKPLNALPPPTADGVDKLHRELAKIHSIAATQLVECTHWCLSDPGSSLVQDRTSWQRPATEPPQQGWHHNHRLISRPRPHCGNGASASNPKLADRLAKGTRARDCWHS